MIRKNCENCGHFFWVKSYRKDDAKFCNYSCYHDTLKKEENRHGPFIANPKNKTIVICHVCGDKFKEYKSNLRKQDKIFCSIKCKAVYQKKGRYDECKKCGDLYYLSKSDEKEGRKFCSMECASQYNNPTRVILNRFNLKKEDVPEHIIEANVEVYELKRQIRQVKR